MNRRPFFSLSRGALSAATFLLTAGAALGQAAPTTVALEANRLSGPAPLAVFFDASGTTSSEVGSPFHDLRYWFDFGDERPDRWTFSRKLKNQQVGGPLAAHVYDVPGTYTVRVRAPTPSRVYSRSIRITVEDPDTVFAGGKTICVSTSGDFSGCPAGALQQSSLPAEYNGQRVLLRRGDSFGQVTIRQQDDSVIVGSYGMGPKPRVERVSIGVGNPVGGGVWPDDITIMDLDIANGIVHENSGSRFLIYRNSLDDLASNANNSITIGQAIDYYAERMDQSQFYNPREIFIVQNRVLGSSDSDQVPLANLHGIGARIAIMGNNMGKSWQHTLRLYRAHKAFIAHNALRGQSSDGIRHALKLHSGGLGRYDDSYAVSGRAWASTQIVVANNRLGRMDDNNSWTSQIAPQNLQSAEGIEDLIVENNRFSRGPRTNTDAVLLGRRITTRRNVRTDGSPVNINSGPANYALPPEWQGPVFVR
jgi:hypothetical protein